MLFPVIIIQFLFFLPWTFGTDSERFLRFPNGFMLGAASSAYQIEGAWNVSGKGLSIWDRWTHEAHEKIEDQSNGDIACDSYHKYKEDIQIVKDIGFNHFRLSLSWTRILPNGFADYVNREGIQHYKNVIDELRSKGIEPFVTIYHWDLPDVLEQLGGWANELIVEWFADYARVVFRELGSRVRFWTTINEPTLDCRFSYEDGIFPPGLKLEGLGPYICGHNKLKAHARAYRIYDQEFRYFQHGKIGLVLPCGHHFPIHASDAECSNIGYQFECGWLAHPIFSKHGDYPQVMKDRIGENSRLQGLSKSRLPVLSPAWIDYIRGTADYYGLNHYSSYMCEIVPRTSRLQPWYEDSGIKLSANESWPVSYKSWLSIVPKGLRGILGTIKEEYNNPPVYILENGTPDNGELNDINKINYLYSYMEEMLLAIHRDQCNVKSHTVWSLLDSYEWDSGYTLNFGLVHVNYTDPNRSRTPRLSASWLKSVIASRKLLKLH